VKDDKWPCMTPDELARWRRANHGVGRSRPCLDCLPEFEAESLAAGVCVKNMPKPVEEKPPRPTRPARPGRHGHLRYATEEERRAARRETWRESQRRARAAAA
jgi:hypothetical protein